MSAQATRDYLERYHIKEVIQEAVNELCKKKPENPVNFLIDCLKKSAAKRGEDAVIVVEEKKTEAKSDGGKLPSGYPAAGSDNVWEGLDECEEWIRSGCADRRYNCPEKGATFAVDGVTPDTCPDITEHKSFMTDALKANPGLWDELKDKKTALGTTLADCIKCGIDNKGHPMIKIVGMTAGDPEAYDVFAPLFDPVISARHGGYAADAKQPTNLNIDELSDTDIDPECRFVLTTRVRTGRSVSGFKFPPSIEFEERRKLEKLIVKGLLAMEGDLKGDYFPLHGSKSYEPKPNGMSKEEENALRAMGNLFQEPDSTLLLASGMAKCWPDGRGVFHNNDKNLFVWVGEEDHMRIVSMQGSRDAPSEIGKDIKAVTARFIRACNEVEKVLKAEGAEFVHNDHLGWVLTCPSNLGTGLRAGTMVRLEKVTGLVGADFKKLCGAMGLQARGTGGVDSAAGTTWDISNADRIGKGEVDLVNILIESAAQMVKWEYALNGDDADAAAAAEAAIKEKLAS